VVKRQGWQNANNDADPGRTTLIGDLLDAQGMANRMTGLKDLKSTETYIWAIAQKRAAFSTRPRITPALWGHVMITQPGSFGQTADGLTIGVVEATAAGKRELQYIDSTFRNSKKQVKGTVFAVWRGSKSDPMNVRVSRLKV